MLEALKIGIITFEKLGLILVIEWTPRLKCVWHNNITTSTAAICETNIPF